MIDLTPQDKKCDCGASCPGVFRMEPQDLTPEHLRCYSSECPGVIAVADDLLVIGKRGDQLAHDLGKGMSPDEQAVIISPGYFTNLPELVRLREALAEARVVIDEKNLKLDDLTEALSVARIRP